ncbi:TPA: permease [Citrobacter freundii]|nr:permease [Citrobacter freundii]HED3666255.1 permease [Citrobacter freundii]HED3692652.1 permease [Citrobacter freundii]
MSAELQDVAGMFALLAVELSALFLLISLLVGVLQRHVPPARIEALLSAGRFRSYFLAAGLGAITPFCSCSTIPVLKGLIRARAGFGPMMVFLFASPLLNPVIIALMAATFGLILTLIYAGAALLVSLIAGWLLQILGFDKYIRSGVHQGRASSQTIKRGSTVSSKSLCCGEHLSGSHSRQADMTRAVPENCCKPQSDVNALPRRYRGLWRDTWADFRGVFPYLIAGIAIGSIIYGYLPTTLLEQYAGPANPFAIPAAAIIGVPLYIRAEAVIPLAAALLAKGVGAGTVLALIIGSAGASLTELILLRALFRFRLLAAFVLVIISMAIMAGYTAYLFF